MTFACLPLQVADAAAQEGVAVRVGEAEMAIQDLRGDLFLLQVSFGAPPSRINSVFIDPELQHENGKLVREGDFIGLENKSGKLLIDQKTGDWKLIAANQKLISQGSLPALKGKDSGPDSIEMRLSVPNAGKFDAYGAGNGDPKKRQLLQTSGNSHLGNGVAVIPYFWSTSGYGIFGVSSDDDAPAKWSLNEAKSEILWETPGKAANFYLFTASDLYQAARSYADLTGYPAVPPKWSFGYLQSRWGWEDKKYIDEVFTQFKERKLPVDAFIIDFECYTSNPDYSLPPEGVEGYPDFEWNPLLFPSPKDNLTNYLKQGLRIIPIRKPRIGNKTTLAMLREKNWLLTTGKNGEKAELMYNRDMDFRNPELRKWYADQSVAMAKAGVPGWWNDEGESSYTKYYYWNLAQVQMLDQIDPKLRYWSLNRSFQPGMQRLGGTAWTGDVASTWQALEMTPASLLNWGLAGMPFGGCDIGGFKNPKDADGNRATTISPEMMTRWMQAGVFMPIMRSHSARKMVPHFPYLYGEEAEKAMRSALELRYRLIPHLYSLAHEAHLTGAPVMRPLIMEFPDDRKLKNLSDQWLIGRGLMAAPLLKEGGSRKVYFPDNFHVLNDETVIPKGTEIDIKNASLQELPVYVRQGTVLPLGPVVQNTNEVADRTLLVQVYPGKDGVSDLFEDDGITKNYLAGKVRKTSFVWRDAEKELSWSATGDYSGPEVFKKVTVEVFLPSGKKANVSSLNSSGRVKF